MRPAFLTPELIAASADYSGLPELDLRPYETATPAAAGVNRRRFLGAALTAAAFPSVGAEPLVFDAPVASPTLAPAPATREAQLQLGEIPSDFWTRPRTLRLYRKVTNEHLALTYWRDGKLDPEGYWRACAVLRDVSANRMTAMDPLILDIMRGMLGYYEAWKWPYPLVVNSGFRTDETNRKLLNEGAARNSLHLYGRAVDLYMPGVSVQDIGRLALHFQQGGVGFYPGKSFVHVDTGRIRTWNG